MAVREQGMHRGAEGLDIHSSDPSPSPLRNRSCSREADGIACADKPALGHGPKAGGGLQPEHRERWCAATADRHRK